MSRFPEQHRKKRSEDDYEAECVPEIIAAASSSHLTEVDDDDDDCEAQRKHLVHNFLNH